VRDLDGGLTSGAGLSGGKQPGVDEPVNEVLVCLASDAAKVVIGRRADFYHLALADLGERLAVGQVALAPMSNQDLYQAIVTPANKLGRSFQPGLVGGVETLPEDADLSLQRWQSTSLDQLVFGKSSRRANGFLGRSELPYEVATSLRRNHGKASRPWAFG
jgi:hypothetical protein